MNTELYEAMIMGMGIVSIAFLAYVIGIAMKQERRTRRMNRR